MSKPKETSWEYGREYQLHQADKYRTRDTHHWKPKIELAHRLVEQYAVPRLGKRAPEQMVVVDVGCSIGTFAIEFQKAGYRSYGVDFDAVALEIGRELAREEGVSPEFVCADVSNWPDGFPPIDVAVCFDIFEHLHDDEIGSFLTSIRRQLNKQGCVVFFTTPTEYDRIFRNRFRRLPLLPFAWLSSKRFASITKAYAGFLDIVFLLTEGLTYRDSIAREGHCNPLSAERLAAIFGRAGYQIVTLESADLFESRPFSKQPIAHKHLYGVAVSGTCVTEAGQPMTSEPLI